MGTVATLTKGGRAEIAASIAEKPLYLAWGEGEAEWDDLPDSELPSLVDRKALFNEIGRRLTSFVGFCEPDDNGDIVVPIGETPDGQVEVARYQQKDEPTPWLYLRTAFDFGDASHAIIRELGIFRDTKLVADLPVGQTYFLPNDVDKPGTLMAMQIVRPKILRSPAVRQTIEFVLPI